MANSGNFSIAWLLIIAPCYDERHSGLTPHLKAAIPRLKVFES